MAKKNDIVIHTQVLSEPDYETASANIRCQRNVVVVEMMPIPRRVGGILLGGVGDRSRRDDVGMVVACDPDCGYYPGQYVVCVYGTGQRMKNFWAGTYRAKCEVRIFGRTQMDSSDEYRIRKFPLEQNMPASINVNMFDIDLIQPGVMLPIHKRINDNTYESYVRVEGSKEFKFKITDFSKRNVNTITLKGGRAYRVTVGSIGANIFDVVVDDIGEWTKTIARAVDRTCPILPIATECLVELDELHDKSVGGIYLPDEHSSRDTKLTVIKVGSRCQGVNVGDRAIMLSSASGRSLVHMGVSNNKNLRLIPYDSILTFLDSEKDLTKRDLEKLNLVCA